MHFPKQKEKNQKLKTIYTKTVTLAVFVLFIFTVNPVFAAMTKEEFDRKNAEYTKQIAEVTNSILANKQQQQTLQSELANIDSQVAAIQQLISVTQGQLDLLNQQISDTEAQITQAEEDLKTQKRILGEYLKVMYMNGQTTTVELIVSSNSLSDFVDKSQYLETMQQKIQETTKKIEALKLELDKKKNELEVDKAKNEQLQASQVAQRASIVSQQNYKNSLLADAEASADALSKQKNDLYIKKQNLSDAFNETIITGSGSGYPWGSPVPQSLSCNYGTCTEDGMGYYIGQCTSYVAWRRKMAGKPIPPAIGNGGQWTGANAGYPQDYSPQPGDAMVFPYLGGYGHVAYVEEVNNDGTVVISEYNWIADSYTVRTVNPYNYSAYFIH